MQKVLIIVGPTASGKSALGVALARRFSGEVISADSRQIYKGLDIGTGKITKKEMRGVPHHLLDVTSPKRTFTAGDYTKQAQEAVADVARRRKLPLVVGGTGFYIDALVGRISLPDVAPNATLRARLRKKAAPQLFSMLKKKDAARAAAMDTPSERNNKVRLMRALEVAGARKGSTAHAPAYDALWIGVRRRDSELRKRINTRLNERIPGMVREARRLHARGLSYKRMRELGLEYRALARFLQKVITLPEMEKELQSDIWRYARKQIGYWKRNRDIEWFDPGSKNIVPTVKKWLAK